MTQFVAKTGDTNYVLSNAILTIRKSMFSSMNEKIVEKLGSSVGRFSLKYLFALTLLSFFFFPLRHCNYIIAFLRCIVKNYRHN